MNKKQLIQQLTTNNNFAIMLDYSKLSNNYVLIELQNDYVFGVDNANKNANILNNAFNHGSLGKTITKQQFDQLAIRIVGTINKNTAMAIINQYSTTTLYCGIDTTIWFVK